MSNSVAACDTRSHWRHQIGQLDEIKKSTPQILGMVNFNEGNRYSDFDPKIDKVATCGIAALVAGGVAAKLGFFKLAWVFILAAKKFIIIGFAAVASFFQEDLPGTEDFDYRALS